MALPDYSFLIAGTAITWTSSGGDKTLTLTSKTDGTGCEGDKSATLVDGTLGMPELLEVRIEIKLNATATDGKEIELYFGESDSATAGTNNPGNLTGAAADVSNPGELKRQCNYVGSLVLSAARTTSTQKQRFRYRPLCPYIVPFVINSSGQTLGSTGTDQKIVVTPYYRKIAD